MEKIKNSMICFDLREVYAYERFYFSGVSFEYRLSVFMLDGRYYRLKIGDDTSWEKINSLVEISEKTFYEIKEKTNREGFLYLEVTIPKDKCVVDGYSALGELII